MSVPGHTGKQDGRGIGCWELEAISNEAWVL